jgi:hypothetical protein
MQIREVYDKIVTVVPEFGQRHTLEEFMHVYCIVTGRYFGVNAISTVDMHLLPYADMANATSRNQPNAKWRYDPIANRFQYYALAPIPKGQPVSAIVRFSRF